MYHEPHTRIQVASTSVASVLLITGNVSGYGVQGSRFRSQGLGLELDLGKAVPAAGPCTDNIMHAWWDHWDS